MTLEEKSHFSICLKWLKVSFVINFDLSGVFLLVDVFALIINFWAMVSNQSMWQFEIIETSSQTLTKSLTKLLKKYGLRGKNVAYLKDKGFNINVMTIALKLVISCEYFSLKENFQGTCFGHVFSKAYKYGIVKEKVYNNLKYVFIKSIQVNLQKCVTWL